MSDVEQAFETAVRAAFDEAKRALKYNPSRALRMVDEHGAVEAARRILNLPGLTSEGLTTLWEKHRLDLSIEALLLKPEFASLFTDEERELARKILKDHGGYQAPWDTPTATGGTEVQAQPPIASSPPPPSNSLPSELPSTGGIPNATREDLLAAMRRFDAEGRNAAYLRGWETNQTHRYAIRYQGRLYPVKEIIARATGINTTSFSGGDQANSFVMKRGFEVVERDSNGNFPPGDPNTADDVTEDKAEAPVIGVPVPVAQWQVQFQSQNPFVSVLAQEYPNWLHSSLPDDIKVVTHSERWLEVQVKNQRLVGIWFNNVWNAFVFLYEPTPDDIALLDKRLSNGNKLRPPTKTRPAYRFYINSNSDYELLKEVTRRMVMRALYTGGVTIDWPERYDTPTFVVIHGYDENEQRYGETYSFGPTASGDRRALEAAVRGMQAGGPPVHLVLYRPTPRYAFTAWAKARQVRQVTGQDGVTRWALDLEHHELPVALDLKGNAQRLRRQMTWLADLNRAFNFKAIRQIQGEEFMTIMALARELAEGADEPDSPLPRTLGDKLRPYVQLVSHLGAEGYTPEQIVERLGRIEPRIAPELKGAPDAAHLAHDLVHLRLLEPLGDGRYRRWAHLADTTLEHMLRYAALTLLLPDGQGGYYLPISDVPVDDEPHALDDWGRAAPVLPWYAEAGLAREVVKGMWAWERMALTPIQADTPTAVALNTFIENWRHVRVQQVEMPPVDGALPALDAATLDARIAEMQRELLIERSTILRIYRSLIAGQHVILSGPPGTGKTHLARLLPRVLWRDEITTLRLPTEPGRPPTEPPHAARRVRHGYSVELATATEDWGVRHIVGGIMPSLERNGTGRTLVYRVAHGCLTRAVLANYAEGEADRLDSEDFTRQAVRHGNDTYRGRWLVIDELTRAPIDAAFGSVLTTLGGQADATLAVPTDEGGERHIPLPGDFRLIGTLNSFDRHFLNQMSEALKRRFVFIDILPPGRQHAATERAMAVYKAVTRLKANGITAAEVNTNSVAWTWNTLLEVSRQEPGRGEMAQYRLDIGDNETEQAILDFWRIFEAARVYRQFGTAQAESVYTALLAGQFSGMAWADALDYALADGLADQLQVLHRDEQRVLQAYIEYAGDAAGFTKAVESILKTVSDPRQRAHLTRMRLADPAPGGDPIDVDHGTFPTQAQLSRLFNLGQRLLITPQGSFARRLDAFVQERGL